MDRKLNHKVWLIFTRLLRMESDSERNEEDTMSLGTREKQLLEEMLPGEEYLQRRKIMTKIEVEKELEIVLCSRETRILRHMLLWRVATVILPLVIGGLFVWKYTSTGYGEQVVSLGEVYPGKSGATLFLSDGTERDLTTYSESIQEQGGKEIRVDSARLDYEVQKVDKGEKQIYNKLLVGKGFEYMLVLNDGTKVWMNSDSELEYPVAFGGGSRRVKLVGEAYFEVAKDSTRPFIVEVTQGFEVQVLGTRFNVKAYHADSHYETTLVEGKVQVKSSTGEAVVLKPSEQASIGQDGEFRVREVNPSYYTAWHEGWFYFDESLGEALRVIGRWYDVDFNFTDISLREIKVTGKVKRFETLDVILGMLNQITRVQFERNGKMINVK